MHRPTVPFFSKIMTFVKIKKGKNAQFYNKIHKNRLHDIVFDSKINYKNKYLTKKETYKKIFFRKS